MSFEKKIIKQTIIKEKINIIMKIMIQIMLNANIKFMKNKMRVLIIKMKIIIIKVKIQTIIK